MKVTTVIGSIVVFGVLTYCALLHSEQVLKATQMNIQCNLIWELLLYKFQVGYNAVEATKIICCTNCEVPVDHNTVTRWFKKFCSDCKNLENQTMLGQPKTIDLRLCSKRWREIQQVTLGEYQVSLASYSTVWFVTFQTLAKEQLNCALCYLNFIKLLTHPSFKSNKGF